MRCAECRVKREMVSPGRSGKKVRLIRDDFYTRNEKSFQTVAVSPQPGLPCRQVVWMPGNVGESAYPETNVKLMGRRRKVGRCEL